jgi:hypothetical protein
MKSCILLLLFSLFLASVARALPQQSPEQANLIAYAHFKADLVNAWSQDPIALLEAKCTKKCTRERRSN